MYHICQEEDSIGVTLVVESVLLGERVLVLDLVIIVIILLLRIKIFVSPLARLDLSSSTKGVFTLIHLNAHWTKSHQAVLNQFAFAPFTLCLLKANSITDCQKYIVRRIMI